MPEMTDEQIAKLKEDAKTEVAKAHETEVAKLKTEKENLNKALHAERQKKGQAGQGEVTVDENVQQPAFDENKIKEIAAATSAEAMLRAQVDTMIVRAGATDDERKVIRYYFERLKGDETDPQKLAAVVTEATILANKDRVIANPSWMMGSASGGRAGTVASNDDGSARRMGAENFGLGEADYTKKYKV